MLDRERDHDRGETVPVFTPESTLVFGVALRLHHRRTLVEVEVVDRVLLEQVRDTFGVLVQGREARVRNHRLVTRTLVADLDDLVAVEHVVDGVTNVGVVVRLLHVVEAQTCRPPVDVAEGRVLGAPATDLWVAVHGCFDVAELH